SAPADSIWAGSILAGSTLAGSIFGCSALGAAVATGAGLGGSILGGSILGGSTLGGSTTTAVFFDCSAGAATLIGCGAAAGNGAAGAACCCGAGRAGSGAGASTLRASAVQLAPLRSIIGQDCCLHGRLGDSAMGAGRVGVATMAGSGAPGAITRGAAMLVIAPNTPTADIPTMARTMQMARAKRQGNRETNRPTISTSPHGK